VGCSAVQFFDELPLRLWNSHLWKTDAAAKGSAKYVIQNTSDISLICCMSQVGAFFVPILMKPIWKIAARSSGRHSDYTIL
jgi:hypothetical protein